MQKILKLSLFFIVFSGLMALSAQDNSQDTPISTAKAKLADNKAKVVLIGMIVKRNHDYYLRDLTGQVKLEFPKDKLYMIDTVSKVKLEGRVKTNLLRYISKVVDPTIRVISVEIYNPKSVEKNG